MTIYHRFMKFVSIDEESGCWNWEGSLTHKGYGQFHFDGMMYRSHRFSYILFIGEIPESLYVLHSCDNPSCVNPGHLLVGSNQDNMDDKVIKGRQNHSVETKLKISIAKRRFYEKVHP